MSVTRFIVGLTLILAITARASTANGVGTPGDCDADGDIDLVDHAIFSNCFAGPSEPLLHGSCACMDFDADGDVDAHDAVGFAVMFTGTSAAAGETSDSLHPKIAGLTALNVLVRSGGISSIPAAPGAEVPYEVVVELSNAANEGLASILLDLSYSGGALSQPAPPSSGPMLNFQTPAGIANPLGYAGTPIAGMLVQVGGVQNVIKNTPENAAFPIGTVITGVAYPGSPQVLLSGAVTAPMADGTYSLAVSNVVASVIRDGEIGQPFWATEFAGLGAVTDLTIEVGSNPPTGACCSLVGSCTVVEATVCLLVGGPYSGDGSSCEGDADSDGRDGQCGDECPTDSGKIALGQCGCGVSDVDTDGDTSADCLDLCPGKDDRTDADGNGTPDCLETAAVPSASIWGLIVLALALLTLAKQRFAYNAPIT